MASMSLGRILRRVRAGERHSVWHLPGLAAPETLRVTSPAFEDGAPMPENSAGEGLGDNTAPPLAFAGVPEGTRCLLLIIEDVDVPLPRPILHTIALLAPDRAGLGEGELGVGAAGIRFVPAGFGRTGYQGPRPVPGHGPHRYGFLLFALDVEAPAGEFLANLKALLPLVDGHVLARGRVTGTFEQ